MSDLRKALESCVAAMEIQQKRESGEFHLSPEAMDRMWEAAITNAVLALQSPPAEDGYVRGETPITDAAIRRITCAGTLNQGDYEIEVVYPETARTLERSLASARESEARYVLGLTVILNGTTPEEPSPLNVKHINAVASRALFPPQTAQEPDQQSPDRASEGGGLG